MLIDAGEQDGEKAYILSDKALRMINEALHQKIRRLRLEVVGAKGYMSTTSIAMQGVAEC